MSEKDLIEKIPNWEYTYLYEGSRSFGKSYIQHLLNEKDKEIERLNNIINELEKFLNEVMESYGYETDITDRIEKITIKNILRKLKELKENKYV